MPEISVDLRHLVGCVMLATLGILACDSSDSGESAGANDAGSIQDSGQDVQMEDASRPDTASDARDAMGPTPPSCTANKNGRVIEWSCSVSETGFTTAERADFLPMVVATGHSLFVFAQIETAGRFAPVMMRLSSSGSEWEAVGVRRLSARPVAAKYSGPHLFVTLREENNDQARLVWLRREQRTFVKKDSVVVSASGQPACIHSYAKSPRLNNVAEFVFVSCPYGVVGFERTDSSSLQRLASYEFPSQTVQGGFACLTEESNDAAFIPGLVPKGTNEVQNYPLINMTADPEPEQIGELGTESDLRDFVSDRSFHGSAIFIERKEFDAPNFKLLDLTTTPQPEVVAAGELSGLGSGNGLEDAAMYQRQLYIAEVFPPDGMETGGEISRWSWESGSSSLTRNGAVSIDETLGRFTNLDVSRSFGQVFVAARPSNTGPRVYSFSPGSFGE